MVEWLVVFLVGGGWGTEGRAAGGDLADASFAGFDGDG